MWIAVAAVVAGAVHLLAVPGHELGDVLVVAIGPGPRRAAVFDAERGWRRIVSFPVEGRSTADALSIYRGTTRLERVQTRLTGAETPWFIPRDETYVATGHSATVGAFQFVVFAHEDVSAMGQGAAATLLSAAASTFPADPERLPLHAMGQ